MKRSGQKRLFYMYWEYCFARWRSQTAIRDTGIFYGTLYSMESRWLTLGACFVDGMFPAGDTAYQIRSGNGGNYPDHPSDRMGR